GFAEQTGGRLILHSRQGRGTTVELWMPVPIISAQPVAPPQPQAAMALRPLTILAVDDDALVLMNTVAMLEDLGYTVFEAYSAKETLVLLRREAYLGLVVMYEYIPNVTE